MVLIYDTTVSCLLPLPRFKSHLGYVRKVASDLGLGGGFGRVLRFPPPVRSGWSRPSHNMAEKGMKNEISNFRLIDDMQTSQGGNFDSLKNSNAYSETKDKVRKTNTLSNVHLPYSRRLPSTEHILKCLFQQISI